MLAAHIYISGFVQGVGFRQFIKKRARNLGITGWVRNTKDNRVEAVFECSGQSEKISKERIENLIDFCRKGPFLAEVKDVLVNWETSEDRFIDFKVSS